MRGLNLLDIVIIGAVVAVLVYAGSRDFGRYVGRTIVAPVMAVTPPGK